MLGQDFARICSRAGLVVCFLSSLALMRDAQAALLVDTGEPDPVAAYPEYGTGLFAGERRAGRFTVDADWRLTRIETHVGGTSGLGLSATLAIYGDNAGGLVPGQELYATEFVNTDLGTLRNDGAWEAVEIPGWALTAATYWISVEVRPGQTMSGNLSNSGTEPLPHPLATYAWFTDGEVPWNESFGPTDSFAVRIHAGQVPVPSAWMLLAGACFIVGWQRLSGTPSTGERRMPGT